MSTETVEELRKALRDSEAKVEQLKSILVALKAKSTEVQELCKRQKGEHDRDLALLEEFRQKEDHLVRRCEQLETRNKQLEDEKLPHDLDAAERVPKPSHQGFDDIQQALVKTRQTEGGTDDTVMQSAVSVCEGALGILKAALAGTLTGQHPDKTVPSQVLHHVQNADDCREPQPLFSNPAKPRDFGSPQGQKRSASEVQRDKDFDLLHAQSVVRRPHLGELNSDRNLAAIDIAQFWLSTLIQGQITQEFLKDAAAGLLHEVKVSKRCPKQCLVTCTVLSISHCANSFGSLQASDEDSSNGSGAQATVQDGTAVEDIAFSRVWYDIKSRRQGALSNLVACVSALDSEDGRNPTDSKLEFSAAVAEELRWCLLIEHRPRGCATIAEDCAMTSALLLLLRIHGQLQAARVFLVDLLTSSADHLEACLPCLTAALAAWPEVLHKKSSPSMGQEEALLQARVSSRFSRRLLFVEKNGILMLCQRLKRDLSVQDEDTSTSAGSISGTTMAAAARNSIGMAADYLMQIGKDIWGWEPHPESIEKEADKVIKQHWANYFQDAAEGNCPAGNMGLGCCLSASFVDLNWTCSQAMSSVVLPQLEEATRENPEDKPAVSLILQNLLVLSQLNKSWSHPVGPDLIESLQQAQMSKACPQPARHQLQALLRACIGKQGHE